MHCQIMLNFVSFSPFVLNPLLMGSAHDSSFKTRLIKCSAWHDPAKKTFTLHLVRVP